VYERHGGGHGLHIHALLDCRLDVTVVRPIAERFGFGRIHVEMVKKEASELIGKYMGKYLTKAFQKRPDCLKYKRLWACIGEFKGSLVKNIKIDSPFTRFFKKMSFLRRLNPTECENQIMQVMPWFQLDAIPKGNSKGSRFYWLCLLRKVFPQWEFLNRRVEFDGEMSLFNTEYKLTYNEV
jgi:hypothetical protein